MKTILKNLNLSKFISFDLETTGLDRKTDSVIEFSGVLFEDGEPTETLSFLCDPGISIPANIELLTGITNSMVKGNSAFEERLDTVVEFISDIPLVAHNIGFDISFLKQYLKRDRKLKIKNIYNRLYDTALLSQALFFYLTDHKLGTVAEYCGYSKEGAHRAETDAINVGKIFIQLIKRVLLYDFETFQTINLILEGTNDPNKWLYRNLSERLILNKSLGDNKPPQIDWILRKNVIGKNNNKTLPSELLDDYFGEDGLIAKSLTGFEERPQQKEMAEIVLSCLENGTHSMVEAGTGVGKSLAYLIPAIIWLNKVNKRGRRLVIASNTKTLQEQIFFKEIPFLSKKLRMPFKAVLLKGRQNYICLTRWYKLLADLSRYLHIANRSSIIPIVIWLKHTRTGDISENNGFKLRRNHYIWNEICSEPGYCTTRICQKYGGCFLGKVRDEAQTSDILIVNHSLLLADAAMEKGVIPEYTALVVDEAHNLEKNAYEYFASRINLPILNYILRNIHSGSSPEGGILIDILLFSQQLKKRKDIEPYIERVKDKVDDLKITGTAFFKRIALEKMSVFGVDGKTVGLKKRYKKFEEHFPNFNNDISSFMIELEDLNNKLKELIVKAEELVSEDPKLFDELRLNLNNILSQLEGYYNTYEIVTACNNDDLIFWYSIGSDKKETSVEISYTPLHVSKYLHEYILKNLHSTILSSATLQVDNSFEYLKERTGMNSLAEDDVVTASLGSPFLYSEQAIFCTYHADLKRNNDLKDAASLIMRLAGALHRGIMVLFKSYSSLIEVLQLIQPGMKKLGIPILAQGQGTSRTNLLEYFREKRDSVLLGTDSFWEGVDLIGPSLEVLVIHKLPFAVPSEPIIEANM